MILPFLCLVVSVHDGDGPLHCQTGEKIRVAGIQAPDFTNTIPCRERRAEFTCDDAAARRSRDIVARMVQGKQLRCAAVGSSYSRVVAACTLPDGRDLSCAVIQAGAAVRWDSYWRRYNMPPCRPIR